MTLEVKMLKKIIFLLVLSISINVSATDIKYRDFMKQMPETLDYFGRTFQKVKFDDFEAKHPKMGYSLLYAENPDDIYQKCRVSLVIYDENYDEGHEKNKDGAISCIDNDKNDNPITKEVLPCHLKRVVDMIRYVIPSSNDFHVRTDKEGMGYGAYGTGDETYEGVFLVAFDGHFIKSRVTCYQDSAEKAEDTFLMSFYHLGSLIKEMKTYFNF